MKNDGKFDQGRYHTIPETKNIKLPISDKHIMLGVKVKNAQGIEYPKELPFFVCPPEIKAVFGNEPTELIVYFPKAIREEVFPQAYEKYGKNQALQCIGDGEVSKTAQRLNLENGRWEDRVCPCEHYNVKYDPKTKIGGCSKVGHLRFMLPDVSIGVFYQCSPHGTVSISELNSAFKLADITTGGDWAMIPFRMRRVAKKLKIPGTAKMKTHWVITLEVAATAEQIKRVKAGEILYLGQLKKGQQYELEAPALPHANRVYVKEETEEETAAREERAREAKEAEDTFYKESKEREEKLKKEVAAGKHKLKTKEEVKAITKKKDELKKEIEELAQKNGMNKWAELIEMGQRRSIFAKGTVTAQGAMQYLYDHPEECKKFKELIKTDQKIADEDIPF